MNQEISSLLLDRQIEEQLATVRAGYGRKARAVRVWLDEHLSQEIDSVHGGWAGFYFYLTFRQVETHERSAFFHYLTRTTGDVAVDSSGGAMGPRVVYIPGEHCVHPHGDLAKIGRRQLRISYGFEELEAIHRAIRLMREAIDYAKATAG